MEPPVTTIRGHTRMKGERWCLQNATFGSCNTKQRRTEINRSKGQKLKQRKISLKYYGQMSESGVIDPAENQRSKQKT